jgi:phenylpropionate dioxygenase-like ring-hydroxylating dioxygenase large terminal subunit
MIPVRYYFDDEILNRENEKIFQSSWQPVCLKSDLENNNDFYTFLIGGIEGVIQNFHGKLRAFTNSCPHRFSCLQSDKSGNRPLQCPYHRLQFNEHGKPINKTLGEDYSYELMKLQDWNLELCGQLIFVCLNNPTYNLKEYLGPQFAYIENLTNDLGDEIFSEEQKIEANWKIVIQNTMEFDHVFSVHPKTFTEIIQKPLEVLELDATMPSIRYRTLLKELSREDRATQKIFQKFCATSYFSNIPCYEYFLLFPLLTVGHTNGPVSFFRYTPISANETSLEMRTWSPKAHNQNEDYLKFTTKIFPVITAFIKKLSLEDKQICEAVFRGLKSAPKEGKMLFANGDFLIEKFQKYYKSFID